MQQQNKHVKLNKTRRGKYNTNADKLIWKLGFKLFLSVL